MAEFFMGQIMMTGFGYAPNGFAQCNGSTLMVSQNSALFTLLGIYYGGDGVRTFNLPDLRGRAAAGAGYPSRDPTWQPPLYPLGSIGGVEKVSLTPDQNAQHTHIVAATTTPGTSAYLNGSEVLAASGSANIYGPAAALVPLGGGPTSPMGSGAPHDNMQPFQAINFNIALTGIYPSRG